MERYSVPFNNRFTLSRGQLHLSFSASGKKIGYSYIRKNGCSSFKELMGLPRKKSVDELEKTHSFKPWERCDHLIFVYRDPIERMKSLYQNKFIDKDGHEDITRRYERAMSGKPSTFSNFLDFAEKMLDPHCWTQKSHLFPRKYTNAIHLHDLHAAMVEIVGEEQAEPFRHRKNPSKKPEFSVSDSDIEKIREIYAADFRMIDRIRKTRASA